MLRSVAMLVLVGHLSTLTFSAVCASAAMSAPSTKAGCPEDQVAGPGLSAASSQMGCTLGVLCAAPASAVAPLGAQAPMSSPEFGATLPAVADLHSLQVPTPLPPPPQA